MRPLILASASPFRRRLLTDAGLAFDTDRAGIDERAVEAALGDAASDGETVAAVLAQAKAEEVSGRHPQALVIGADQTLAIEGEILHKPADMEAARRTLLRLSGRTHQLHSALALAEAGETVWSHTETVSLTMRQFDPGFVGRYLARVGDRALESVGAYQIEGEGIQLFERIDGDFFAIIGLPLLPLLKELRNRGAIDG